MSATDARAKAPRRLSRAIGDEAKEQRRDEILAAAKRTFGKKGFHATTIGDVAKAAGVSYGSIYWYFDSKDALFHALMDHQEASLREHIDAAIDEMAEHIDGVTFFRSAVRATFEFFEADRDVARLLFQDSLVLGDRFDRHLAGIFEGFIVDIENVLELAQAAGYVVDAPPRIVAFSVAALVSQLALRRLTTNDGMSAEQLADFVVSLLLDGLRPRPEGISA